MRVEFPEYGDVAKDQLENGQEIKFAVLVDLQNETAQKVLLIFPLGLDHSSVVSRWINEDEHKKFLGAGKIETSQNSYNWDSTTCLKSIEKGGFGKEKPENPKEQDKLLAQVREKITTLAKTPQEA